MFFHSSLQPLPRLHIAVRDLQSSQRSASVQSLLLAGLFCTTNSRRVLARERWQTFENSWEKNTIFNEHKRIVCHIHWLISFLCEGVKTMNPFIPVGVEKYSETEMDSAIGKTLSRIFI